MKKYLIVTLVIIVVGAGIGIYFWKFAPAETSNTNQATNANQNINQNTNQIQATNTNTSTDLVKGSSQGLSPYAAVDKDRVASDTIGSNGGVIKTEMPNGIRVYLNVPEMLLNATFNVLPYTEMPTTASHPALSDELGYGLEVNTDSIQMGTRYYLVFDLTGGEASAKAAAISKYYNRCDPARTSFDPFICARRNNVPIDELIYDRDYAVASPIYSDDQDLIFTRPTFSIGIDGLLVTEIKGPGVYIPQKLTQSLAEDLIEGTLVNYDNYSERLEAYNLAVGWGLTDTLTQTQYDTLVSAISGDSYPDMIRSIYSAQGLADLASQFAAQATDEDEIEEWEYLEEEYDDAYAIVRDGLFDEAEADSALLYPGGTGAPQGGAAIGGLNDDDFSGSDVLSSTMGGNFGGGSGSYSSMDDLFAAAEAAQLLGDEEAAQEALDEIKKRAKDTIDEVLNDPNASLTDVIKAMELAQMLGLDNEDEIIEKGMAKLKELLEDEIHKVGASRRLLIELAEICQRLGFNDLADTALKKAKIAPDPECDDIIKKTLENYGIQECD